MAEALRKRLEAAKERLPQEREIPGVYRQVSDLAIQSGLGVALFQPKPSEERDILTEVPIAVTAEGTYHQMGAFLQRVGQMPRIVSLGEFRMLGIDRAPGTVRAELTLATYVFRPEGAPPPPAKPGAPGVGTLVYNELHYRKAGDSVENAKKASPEVVERVEVMEIFRFDGSAWKY
jgi:hypothetical protein